MVSRLHPMLLLAVYDVRTIHTYILHSSNKIYRKTTNIFISCPHSNFCSFLISRLRLFSLSFSLFLSTYLQRRQYIDTHAKSMKNSTKPITWQSICRAQHTMTINRIMELNHCQWLHQPNRKMEVSNRTQRKHIFFSLLRIRHSSLSFRFVFFLSTHRIKVSLWYMQRW